MGTGRDEVYSAQILEYPVREGDAASVFGCGESPPNGVRYVAGKNIRGDLLFNICGDWLEIRPVQQTVERLRVEKFVQ